MTQQIAKRSDIKSWLTSDMLKSQITQAMPKHCTPERFMRILFTSVQKTPKLMQCSQESLFSAFITCSQLGIEPDGRRAHLIPYGSNCQLIIDWKGLAELALRSGQISNLHADVVCENDEFAVNMGTIEHHRINYKSPRGAVFAAYAMATFKDGTTKAEVMSREEIEAIRKRSKSGNNGPWVTDWNEMAKKTCFRRLSKWLPLSPEAHDAVYAGDDVIDLDAGSSSSTVVQPPVFRATQSLPELPEIPESEPKPEPVSSEGIHHQPSDDVPMNHSSDEKQEEKQEAQQPKVSASKSFMDMLLKEGVSGAFAMKWSKANKLNPSQDADAEILIQKFDALVGDYRASTTK